MSQHDWLAIDAGTAPMVRAQELRFAWERFVGAERATSEAIRSSSARRSPTRGGARSRPASTRPATGSAPVVADEDETHERWEEHPLGARRAADPRVPVGDRRRGRLPDRRHRRQRRAAERSRAARACACAPPSDMNFAEGTLWSEAGAGTNAIGTAIAVDHAVQVFGPEHFNEPVQRWTCSAAPIHDPDTGELLGVIDLTGDFSTVHPHSLAVATATAQAVEAQRCGSSCRSATRACAPATATGSLPRPARARWSRRPGRAITRRPARLGRIGPAGDPARRRRARAARPARTRSPSRSARRSRRSSCTPSSRRARRDRRGRCSSSASSAATARSSRSTAARPSCARGWPRSSRCCARTRTG